MKIWREISNFTVKNTVITIGSFDGVHLGHKHILSQLKTIAKQTNSKSVVFTFYPHPQAVLNPNKKFIKLTTIDEKIELIKESGIDHLVIFPFTKDFSQITYKEFIKSILLKKLNLKTLLIGYDNKIGNNGEGTFTQLTYLSKELDFNIIEQNKLITNGITPNSTRIRELILKDKLQDAYKLLGYSYFIKGKVIKGNQIGKKLEFPTANIQLPEDKLIPSNGVYAVNISYKNNLYKGMMNIGTRPTIKDASNKIIIEVHIFDFNKDIYDKYIKVSLLKKIRNEHHFQSLNELKTQLKKDRDTILSIFS